MSWARHRYGSEFAAWLADANEPIDPVVRLAEEAGVVLLHGGGFDGPAWSVRVSLANLRRRLLRRGRCRRSARSSTNTSSTGRRPAADRASIRVPPLEVPYGYAKWQRTGGATRCERTAREQDPGTGAGERHERDPREPDPAGRGSSRADPHAARTGDGGRAREGATGMVPIDTAAVPGLDAKVAEYVDGDRRARRPLPGVRGEGRRRRARWATTTSAPRPRRRTGCSRRRSGRCSRAR